MDATLPLRQINLLNPALMPAREIFSARLIVLWVFVAGMAMAVIAWWAVVETSRIKVEIAKQASRQIAEKARLTSVLGDSVAITTPQEVAAKEQEVRSQKTLLETRRVARDALKRGLVGDDGGPSALLRLVSQSIPPQVWVTEMRVSGNHMDIGGKTLDPLALDVWLERLLASNRLVSKPVPAVKLERVDAPAGAPTRNLIVYSFSMSAALSSPFADDGSRP